MATIVTTVTKSQQVFTRTWTDLDPKVRNALAAAVSADLATLGGYLSGAVGVRALLLAIAVGLLPVLVAYITTSKHREVIEADVKVAAEVAAAVAPAVEVLAPAAAPAVEVAAGAVQEIQAALTEPHLAAPTAS